MEYNLVAEMIFRVGAFKTGAFPLKLHEANPKAPLSPLFLNLRTKDNPKPGPLTDFDCKLIAEELWELIEEKGLEFDAIAGIPNAANPFIEAMESLELIPDDVRVIKLDKEVTETGRRIIPMEGFEYRKGETVLLVDDLVTKAGSKIEAIQAIESEGCIVNDLVVLVDRQQGGEEQLKEAGYNLISCTTINELLSYYKEVGHISDDKYQKCIDYIENN